MFSINNFRYCFLKLVNKLKQIAISLQEQLRDRPMSLLLISFPLFGNKLTLKYKYDVKMTKTYVCMNITFILRAERSYYDLIL